MELINFEDRLFFVKRIIKEDLKPIVDNWKEALGADTVLRRDGLLYFLEEIKEAKPLKPTP